MPLIVCVQDVVLVYHIFAKKKKGKKRKGPSDMDVIWTKGEVLCSKDHRRMSKEQTMCP